MAVTVSLRVLFVKLSFLFLETEIMKPFQGFNESTFSFLFYDFFISFLISSSSGMLARAEYHSGFRHVFLFKWSF